MRLLVVEDDPSISEPLVRGLTREGFEVELAATGAAALAAEPADLVVLDLGLPDVDGTVVCRELRARSGVPIVVVTARGDEIDRVSLLELGADDYVVKPFGFRELVARIRAVLRRAAGVGGTGDPHGGGEVDVVVADLGDGLTLERRARRVAIDGSEVELTPKEYDLFVFLAEDPGAVFTRDQIMSEVWDRNWWGSTKTLDVHIASLRRKIGSDRIDTVRGVGFRLSVPS